MNWGSPCFSELKLITFCVGFVGANFSGLRCLAWSGGLVGWQRWIPEPPVTFNCREHRAIHNQHGQDTGR